MSAKTRPDRRLRIEELQDSVQGQLREIVAGRTILLSGPASGSQLLRQYFRDCGASRVLDLPSTTPRRPQSISRRFQKLNDDLLRPTCEIRARLQMIDPRREALVYAGSYVSAESLDGRRVLGGRLSKWRECEKKRYQSALTGGQGQYAPRYIDFLHDARANDLLEFCAQHLPCVASGDARDCVAMGADYVYVLLEGAPVRTLRSIVNSLYKQCEGVRIAPLTHGLPATYYGFSSSDQHVLYGPVEALVGFHRTQRKVRAPGILVPVSISGRAQDGARGDVAHILGKLVAGTGYRGAFGVDGCLTHDGFIVHEMNTRLCAGFSLMARLYGGLIPFGLVDMVIRERGTDQCGILMGILQDSAEGMCFQADLKLWEDSALERSLRRRIPLTRDAADLEAWKLLVRNRVLAGYTPLCGLPLSEIVNGLR